MTSPWSYPIPILKPHLWNQLNDGYGDLVSAMSTFWGQHHNDELCPKTRCDSVMEKNNAVPSATTKQAAKPDGSVPRAEKATQTDEHTEEQTHGSNSFVTKMSPVDFGSTVFASELLSSKRNWCPPEFRECCSCPARRHAKSKGGDSRYQNIHFLGGSIFVKN